MSARRLLATTVCAVGLLLLLAACSGRRLPPGTPPPEYEPPIVTPWPTNPQSADAGPEHAAESPGVPDSGVAAELSLDAGPR